MLANIPDPPGVRLWHKLKEIIDNECQDLKTFRLRITDIQEFRERWIPKVLWEKYSAYESDKLFDWIGYEFKDIDLSHDEVDQCAYRMQDDIIRTKNEYLKTIKSIAENVTMAKERGIYDHPQYSYYSNILSKLNLSGGDFEDEKTTKWNEIDYEKKEELTDLIVEHCKEEKDLGIKASDVFENVSKKSKERYGYYFSKGTIRHVFQNVAKEKFSSSYRDI